MTWTDLSCEMAIYNQLVDIQKVVSPSVLLHVISSMMLEAGVGVNNQIWALNLALRDL